MLSKFSYKYKYLNGLFSYKVQSEKYSRTNIDYFISSKSISINLIPFLATCLLVLGYLFGYTIASNIHTTEPNKDINTDRGIGERVRMGVRSTINTQNRCSDLLRLGYSGAKKNTLQVDNLNAINSLFSFEKNCMLPYVDNRELSVNTPIHNSHIPPAASSDILLTNPLTV